MKLSIEDHNGIKHDIKRAVGIQQGDVVIVPPVLDAGGDHQQTDSTD